MHEIQLKTNAKLTGQTDNPEKSNKTEKLEKKQKSKSYDNLVPQICIRLVHRLCSICFAFRANFTLESILFFSSKKYKLFFQ